MRFFPALRVLATISIIIALCIQFSYAQTANIAITGTVSPKASDFQLSITPNTTSTINQNGVVNYTITYGSHLYYAGSLTVQAQWYQNTSGEDGLNYQPGSGSNAYGNTSPVVDLVHNKITWTISSFPAQTQNQTITFSLHANGSYTGTDTTTFPVKVRIITPGYTTVDQMCSTAYLYDPLLALQTNQPNTSQSLPSTTTPTSAPTPIAQTTITPTYKLATTALNSITSTLTPTPTQTSQPSQVQSINILNLSQNSTQFAITTTNAKKVTVLYGTSTSDLSNQAPLTTQEGSSVVDINDLNPETTYYMQVVTTDTAGKTTKSDVFSLQTAAISTQPQVAKTSLVVSTDSNILYSANLNPSGSKPGNILQAPQIPIAQNTNYNLTFRLTKTNSIKSVTMILKNISVLGAATTKPIPPPLQFSYPVTEKDNGIYSVQLTNPPVLGVYDTYIRIVDYDGNITTQKVAQIRSLRPFRIYNAKTHNPIEDVRINLYRYDPSTKKYVLLTHANGLENPIYTNRYGQTSEQLPKGLYQANLSALRYEGQTVKFSIGISPLDDFPTVYLKPTAITPLSLFNYFRRALTDYLEVTETYVLAIQASYRFFDLLSLLVITCFVGLSFALFQMKTHMYLSHLPTYLHHHTLHLLGKQSNYIHGSVLDKQTKLSITDAQVYLVNEKTRKILAKVQTTKTGSFLFSQNQQNHTRIFVLAEGYEPSDYINYIPNLKVSLIPGETMRKAIVHRTIELLMDSLSLFFEYILVLSLILEFVLFPAFGLLEKIPFLLLSIINILAWFFFLHEKGKSKTM